MTASLWIGCAAFGALGAVTRALTAGNMTRLLGAGFPWGTATVNLAGALALGVIHGAGAPHDLIVLAGAGFLGSLTTFSTWMLETLRLARRSLLPAAVNLGGSLTLGLVAVTVGNAIGSAL